MQRADIGTVVAQTKTTRTLGMTTAQLVVAVSLAETDPLARRHGCRPRLGRLGQ